jgi:hypothetical protein
MARKLQEFLHLEQGLDNVYEYGKRFNHLSQYDSYYSNTNEKKMVLFCQGLNPMLHEHLTLFCDCTLNKLMSASIEQEDARYARMEERKKMPLSGPTRGAPSGQPHLHPSIKPAAWSSSVVAVEPPSTSANGIVPSGIPIAVYSTSSSTAC